MSIFGRNAKTEQIFTELTIQLAGFQPLELAGITIQPRLLTSGWRKTKPLVGIEIHGKTMTGYFGALETRRFLAGHFSILETWNDSPDELFISYPSSAASDSPAGEALRELPQDSIGILHPLPDGTMEFIAQLERAQQVELAAWLRTLPKDPA